MIRVELPIQIVSEANRREHWRAVANRKRIHRACAFTLLARHSDGPCVKTPSEIGPYIITLTRIGPRTLDDDNLASGFKACRDGVADWLGIDDGDKRLTWRYAQRKGKPKQYAAEVQIDWETT